MVLSGHLLAVFLLPIASGFEGFLAHRKAHESGSVRHLKTKEAVHESGSDFLFSWAKCVICDGYDVRLHLEDVSGKQEIPYKLKSAVTALQVNNVPPRTVYKLVVKRLPTDTSSSEVSGRSYCPEAPPPIEQLQARAVTSSSIDIEWSSKNADGFIARILENNTLIQEKVIPDFSNHTILDITGLKPETNYDVRVTAFYFPPGGKSISPVTSARVKTLPLVLPRIHLKWNFHQEPEIFWKNPVFPAPVAHRVTCTRSSYTIFKTRMSGSVDFVVLSGVTETSAIKCALDTWYSKDEGSKVASEVEIQKPLQSSPPSSSQSDSIQCGRPYYYNPQTFTTSGRYELRQVDGMQFIVLKFWFHGNGYLDSASTRLNYRLCVGENSCTNDWRISGDWSEILVNPAEIKAWTTYTVYFFFSLKCSKASTSDSSLHTTTTGSFTLPALQGKVHPAREISGTASRVSWTYDSSSPTPDYFLVTHCTGDSCISQSASGRNRSISLRDLKPRHVYFVTVQAVKLWDGEALVSAAKMTSIVAPKPIAPDGIALTFNEIGNSSTVQLVIAHNATSDEPPMVEYHVAVCSTPVPLWSDPSLSRALSSNGSCDSMVSTNSSLDLIREPWTFYEVSVFLCYGSFDFNDPLNLTLPVFKPNPSALTEISWDAGSSTVKWEYDASTPTGFSIRICPKEGVEECNATVVHPLDRQYSVDASNIEEDGAVAVVYAFVNYEDRNYDGPHSKVVLKTPPTTPTAHQDTTEGTSVASG